MLMSVRITGNSITEEEARDYELSKQKNPTAVSGIEEENRVLTFAELKELIETGNVDKIPNNKVIPEKLNVMWSDNCNLPRSDLLFYRKLLPVSLPHQHERSHGKWPQIPDIWQCCSDMRL